MVAIIGVLSSIAIQNYVRYSAKSKQSESKLSLASVYSLEKSFHAEYGSYIPDLEAIGWNKSGQTGPQGFKVYYATGWLCCTAWAGSVTGFALGTYTASICQGPQNLQGDQSSCQNLCTTVGYLPDLNSAPNSGSDPQGFDVGSAGLIVSGRNCDVWRINHLKRLQNITLGY